MPIDKHIRSLWSAPQRPRVALRFGGVAMMACVLASGCSALFDFARDTQLAAGEIEGRLVRADRDDEPADFARVLAQGVGAIRRADADGRFRLGGLAPGPWVVQIADDEDGDGWPERSRVVPARLSVKPHDDGLFGEVDRLDGVSLGDVVIDGTTRVSGRVLVEPPGGGLPVVASSVGAVARLVVTRDVDVPAIEAGNFDPASLAAEAQTAADDLGNFVFTGVGTGLLYIVPVILTDAGNAPGEVLKVGAPVFLRGFAGEDLVVPDPIVLVDVFDAPPDTRQVQLELSPPPGGGGLYMMLAPPGSPAPPCEVNPPQPPLPAPFQAVQVFDIPDEAVISTPLPSGVFDIYICVEDQQRADLFEQPIPAPDPGDPTGGLTLLGTALLRDAAADPCLNGGRFDCDGDANPGLPVLDGDDDPNASLWAACVDQCRDAFGPDAGRVLCQTDGQTFDCDDDGDGQPDVTESQACYGLGKGTDLDGDGLCSGTDPFPQCTANTAAACEAGVEDFRPPPREEYRGGGVSIDDGRPFDVTFGQGGFAALEVASGGVQVALDGQGRVVVVGGVGEFGGFDGSIELALWRYEANGAVDETFGTGGITVLNAFGDDLPTDLAISPVDGRIWVSGFTGSPEAPALWSFLPDGAPDPGFNGGVQPRTLPFTGELGFADGIDIDDVGRVFVVGNHEELGVTESSVYVFDSAGAPEPGWGFNGVATFAGTARDIAVDTGDPVRVFVAGGLNDAAAVWSFDLTGALDPSFGEGGVGTFSPLLGNDTVTSIALDAPRVLYLGGFSGTGEAPAAWKMDFFGQPSVGFGETGGVVFGAPTNGQHFGVRVALDSQGRPLFTGTDQLSGKGKLGLWRLDSDDGTLDPGFASGAGFVAHDGTFQGAEVGDELGIGLTVDPGDQILVTGIAFFGAEPRGVTWRFLPDAPLPDGDQPRPDFECGNNIQEPGEGCDDGNLENGDGCDDQCQNEGGGIAQCQTGFGEAPDPDSCSFIGFCNDTQFEATCDTVRSSCDCLIDGQLQETVFDVPPDICDSQPDVVMIQTCGFAEFEAQ